MSDRAVDSTSAATKKSLFRMDLFGIHLAARLIGRDTLLKFFEDASVSSRKPICVGYWKTPLLTGDIATTTTSDDWKTVFVDVTVELHVSKNEVTSTIGMMLQRDDCHEQVYVTAEPLVFSQLKAHCEEIGIDIEYTSPHAIAHSLGGALMGLSSQTVGFDDDKNTSRHDCAPFAKRTILPLRLEYKDLQETGTLALQTNQVDSFSSKSFAMMMQNLKRLDSLEATNSKDHEEEQDRMTAVQDPQSAAILTTSFETWLKALRQSSQASKAASIAESIAQTAPIDQGVGKDGGGKENVAATFKTGLATTLTTRSTDNPTVPSEARPAVAEKKGKEEEPKKPSQPPVKRLQTGYVRVSNPKRKRRGKLTFAKQG
jgi:hypothetical protein